MSAAHSNALPQVVAFARRFGEQHVALAMHAAVPLGLTPELVHLLRVNFVRGAEWIAEADLLLSSLCREAGAELYEMEPAVRQLLLEELQQDRDFSRDRAREVAAFLEAYASQVQPGSSREMRDFLQALRWGARAELDPAGTARELAGALQLALTEGDPADALRVAEVTSTLTAPLLGERELLIYAEELRADSSTFSTTGETTVVQGVALPALSVAPPSSASDEASPDPEPQRHEPPADAEAIIEREVPGSLSIDELAARINEIEQRENLNNIGLRPASSSSSESGRGINIAEFRPLKGERNSPLIISELSDDNAQENDTYIDFLRSKDGAIVEPARAWISGTLKNVVLHRFVPEKSAEEPLSGSGPGRWVLVAGLTAERLPPEVVKTAQALGRALAEAGYGLITGGSPGVDEVAAREYCEQLTVQRRRPDEWLLQVISTRRMIPKFNFGKLVHASGDGWQMSIERADAIVTLSGGGGTKTGAELARAAGKPVLPLAATGRHSAKLHSTMVSEWSATPLRGVSLDDFKRLAATDPTSQMNALLALLEGIFAAQDAPLATGQIYLSYAREDHAAAQRVRDRLQAAGVTVWMDETILQPGDVWQTKLDRALQECSLFMPLLSQHTARRTEGLFRREWNLAIERKSRLSSERPFIVPIAVSEAPETAGQSLPNELAELNWVRAPRGELPSNVVNEIREYLRQPLSEKAAPPREEPAQWILISGLGAHTLPPAVVEITKALAKALARAGYGLVGGGWPGVDRVAARAFGEEVRAKGHKEDQWLRQFVPRNQKADYPGGRIEYVEDDWGVRPEHADAVVLISGAGGTRQMGEMARAAGKPVLPIAATGGDAKEFWETMAKQWESAPLRGLTMKEFSQLRGSDSDLAGAVISLLEKALAPPASSEAEPQYA